MEDLSVALLSSCQKATGGRPVRPGIPLTLPSPSSQFRGAVYGRTGFLAGRVPSGELLGEAERATPSCMCSELQGKIGADLYAIDHTDRPPSRKVSFAPLSGTWEHWGGSPRHPWACLLPLVLLGAVDRPALQRPFLQDPWSLGYHLSQRHPIVLCCFRSWCRGIVVPGPRRSSQHQGH